MECVTMRLQNKLQELEKELNTAVLERSEVIHHALISLLAKQHIMLMSLPGTVK